MFGTTGSGQACFSNSFPLSIKTYKFLFASIWVIVGSDLLHYFLLLQRTLSIIGYPMFKSLLNSCLSWQEHSRKKPVPDRSTNLGDDYDFWDRLTVDCDKSVFAALQPFPWRTNGPAACHRFQPSIVLNDKTITDSCTRTVYVRVHTHIWTYFCRMG